MAARDRAGQRTGGGVSVAITVGVGIPSGRRRAVEAGVVVVGQRVAVVVLAVADLRGGQPDRRVAVVAVGGRGHIAAGCVASGQRAAGVAFPVTVAVGVPSGLCGDVHARVGIIRSARAVLVGVRRVADLCGAGVYAESRVVTVGVVAHVGAGLVASGGGARRVAVAVTIAVGIPSGLCGDVHTGVGIIRGARAVLVGVCSIADLGGTGVYAESRVVAVGVVAHVGAGLVASGGGACGVAVAVAIGVGVPSGLCGDVHARVCIICGARAVFVFVCSIADLGGAGVHGPSGVVAVRGRRHVARGDCAGFGGARSVAVAIAIGVGVEGGGDVVVHPAVAVVVDPVAHNGGRRGDGIVVVVAVGPRVRTGHHEAGPVAIAVHVRHAGRGRLEAGCAGEGVEVAVVTVGAHRHEPRGRIAGGHAVAGVAEAISVAVAKPDSVRDLDHLGRHAAVAIAILHGERGGVGARGQGVDGAGPGARGGRGDGVGEHPITVAAQRHQQAVRCGLGVAGCAFKQDGFALNEAGIFRRSHESTGRDGVLAVDHEGHAGGGRLSAGVGDGGLQHLCAFPEPGQ